jgi:hypothetical protein
MISQKDLINLENFLKIIYENNVKYKYPRTYHMPFSQALASDDKFVKNPKMFDGKNVVVTLKMDGENTTLYNTCLHARSLDSKHHESRDWLKKWHSEFSHEIPDNMRICGENLYAKHSISYENLKSYFYGFSIWVGNECLNWKDTKEWFELLNINPVEEIYTGIYDEKKILEAFKPFKNEHEGFVIRTFEGFSYSDFSNHVAKFVRKNHVQPDSKHWMRSKIIPNKINQITTKDSLLDKITESSFRDKMMEKRKQRELDKNDPIITFETERGSIYKIGKSGTIYRKKYSGSNLESDAISFVSQENYDDIMKLPHKYEDRVIMVRHETGKIIFTIDNEIIAKFPAHNNPKVGLYPVDSKNGYIHVGHKIIKIY